MSLEVCQLHNLLKDCICASNDDNQLVCRECFLQSSLKSNPPQAVRLSLQTKELFLNWTEYILKKMVEFKETVTQMGYSKVFEMKLDPNHPQGSVHELDFKEIQKIALQALQEHRSVTEGNLTFIQGTTTIIEMMHPQFLKDLWNIVCKDTKFNLSNMLSTFKTQLVQAYPSKQIYQYANFSFVEKEIEQMENKRIELLKEYESKIVLHGKSGESTKQTDVLMQKNELPPSHHSLTLQISTQNLPGAQQQSFQLQQDNISTLSNPSPTAKQVKQVQFSQRQILDTVSQTNIDQKQSYEQLMTTIAFLRQNELMYQQKVMNLQHKNTILKSQVERLSIADARVKQLQEQLKGKQVSTQQHVDTVVKPVPQQKVLIELSTQLQSALKSQIQQLTKTQVSLIQENAKLNNALKDMSDIAEGRSRTISDLQAQIKTLSSNLQLKQRSIQQLNQLISNQQQEIAYRQNQVQILGEQIRKKLQRIELLQKSVQEHNKLVANQQQQISHKEQQVSSLNEQITNLKTRNTELENSIKSLNSLISNQEQELSYRENEGEVLEKQIRNLIQKVQLLEKAALELNNVVAEKQHKITQKESEIAAVNDQVKKLVQDNLILNQQLNQITAKKASLQAQVNQLSAQLLVSSQYQEKAKLLQNQLNLINEQNILLTDQVNILKKKHLLAEEQLNAQTQKNTLLQSELKEAKHSSSLLATQVSILNADLVNVRTENASLQQELKFPTVLAAQVVELESDNRLISEDNKVLAEIVMKCSTLLPRQQSLLIMDKLKKLNTFV